MSARYLRHFGPSAAGGGQWIISYQSDSASAPEPEAEECDGGSAQGQEGQGRGARTRRLVCAQLVDASGLHARPFLPPQVCERMREFRGQVIHSSQARSLPTLALQQVCLCVGACMRVHLDCTCRCVSVCRV